MGARRLSDLASTKRLEPAMKSLFLRFVLAGACFPPLAAPAVNANNTTPSPAPISTDTRGITNTGRIVGYASLDGVTFFSFSYEGGVFSALPAPPPPLQASALSINDAGVIVGATSAVFLGSQQGFIFNAGSYAFFTRPGWDETVARAISNTNLITGYSQHDSDGSTAGFIYDPITSVYTDITIPGSLFTIAQGINVAGQVVGSAAGFPGGTQAFLRQPDGTITLFKIGTAPTRARGINDVGLITGFMTVGAVNQGFVGSSGGFETLMVPGSDETFPEGINYAGQVIWR